MPFPSLPRLFNAVLPRTRPYSPMGVAGTPVYAGYVLSPERDPMLVGQQKYRTFADILTNTSIVAAGMRYFLNLVARPEWSCKPVDQTDQAKKAAEFVDKNLFHGTKTPWSRIVRRAGTYRFYGFQIQEWTAKKEDDGTIVYDDVEARPQWTIWRWEVNERGLVVGAWQRDPLTGRELGLPRTKLLYLVDDTITDSPEGIGLLRHVVEPVNRLKEYQKQEGFGFERDLRGIPIGKAPITELQNAVNQGLMSQAQMDSAIQELMDFVSLERKNQKTSLLVNSQPYVSRTDTGDTISQVPKWAAELISGAAPGLGDVHNAINRINTEIARILGIEHLMLGGDAAGSYAMAKDKSANLYLLANSVLRDIRLQVQHDLLLPLWNLNGWDEKWMPELMTEDIAPKDVAQVGQVLQQMAMAGAPIPPGDEETINFVRDLLGAPHVDLERTQDMYPPDLMDAQQGYPAAQQQVTQQQQWDREDDQKQDSRAHQDDQGEVAHQRALELQEAKAKQQQKKPPFQKGLADDHWLADLVKRGRENRVVLHLGD